MRTEEDLRTAFDHLAESAPSADEVLATLRTTRQVRRRRTPLIVATVLATTAAAVGGPLAMQLRDPKATDSARPVGDSSAWTPWVTVPVPQKMRILPRIHTENRQVYEFSTPELLSAYCLLTVHRNGDFDPKTIPAGSPTVDVNRAKGRVIASTEAKPLAPLAGFTPGFHVYPVKTIAWQPESGLWALVACQTQYKRAVEVPHQADPWKVDLPKALSIAKAVSASGQRLASPYRIGYAPEGMQPNRVIYENPVHPGEGAGRSFMTLLADGDPSTGYVKKQQSTPWDQPNLDPRPGDDLKIFYTSSSKLWNLMSRNRAIKPDLRINGIYAWSLHDGLAGDTGKTDRNGIRMEGGGMAVTIESLGGTLSMDEVRKVAEQLQLAKSSTDTTTWFDAATAIPAPR